jgi:hypothetical protein
MPYNIERHPILKGDYIGYDADGFAFRIRPSTLSNWKYMATPSHMAGTYDPRALYADTLKEMSEKLAQSHREESNQ